MTQLRSFDSNSSFFCCPYYSRLADSPNIVYTHWLCGWCVYCTQNSRRWCEMAEFDLHLDGRVMTASFPKRRRRRSRKNKTKIFYRRQNRRVQLVWRRAKEKEVNKLSRWDKKLIAPNNRRVMGGAKSNKYFFPVANFSRRLNFFFFVCHATVYNQHTINDVESACCWVGQWRQNAPDKKSLIIKKEALGDITHIFILWFSRCDIAMTSLLPFGCSGNGRGVLFAAAAVPKVVWPCQTFISFYHPGPPFWLRPAFTMRFTCAIQFTFFFLPLFRFKEVGPRVFPFFLFQLSADPLDSFSPRYNPAPRLGHVFDSLFNLLSAYT